MTSKNITNITASHSAATMHRFRIRARAGDRTVTVHRTQTGEKQQAREWFAQAFGREPISITQLS